MGVNICIYDEQTGKEVIDWDWFRHAGDRDIAKLIGELPHISRNGLKDNIKFPDFEYHYRPSDFSVWRDVAKAHQWPNMGRFERLIDLLEDNPTYWIYLSY